MTTTHTLPQGTMAQALIAADVPSSNYVYFDLAEHIDTKLLQGEVKARTFASIAWWVDMRCINLARGVFFEAYRESLETGTIDALNEFTNKMNELAAEGASIQSQGIDQTTSFDQLVNLLNVRKFWHDQAQIHAVRPYEPKSLTELVVGERARTVTIEGRAKIELRANFAAGGDVELAKKLAEMLTTKTNSTMAQQHELRQKLNPAVLRILDFASNRSATRYDDESDEFHTLDTALQRMLIEASVKAVDRALDDMITRPSVSIDEYTIAFKDAEAYKKSIAIVLQAPKYQEH